MILLRESRRQARHSQTLRWDSFLSSWPAQTLPAGPRQRPAVLRAMRSPSLEGMGGPVGGGVDAGGGVEGR